MDKKTEKKRRSYIIPKRNIMLRYPRTFIHTTTVVALLIFFSRPLYDIFFRTDFLPAPPPEKRREALLKQWKI